MQPGSPQQLIATLELFFTESRRGHVGGAPIFAEAAIDQTVASEANQPV